MTLLRVKRSHFAEIAFLALAAIILLSVGASALTIISPTEGAKVREKVKIVIPRSAVPTDGFVTISVDGKFRASAALPEEMRNDANGAAPASPYYTYIWDTKAPVQSVNSTEAPIILKDGKHDVEVQVHDAIGRRVGISKVSVNVQNKPAIPNPAPPFKLYYKFHLGDQTVYRCRIDGEILDNLGQPLLSGVSAVKTDYDVIQTIEEARKDGTALVRYKIGPDATALLYGNQIPMIGANGTSPSIYKLIDNRGKVLQSDLIRKTNTTITDIMAGLPTKPVQVGETWTSNFRLKIEGFGDAVPYQMNNRFDSVEWEGGRECAKIISDMTALGKIQILPGAESNDEQTPIKGTGVFYFAYKTGKLIRASATLESNLSIDQATLTNLQQGTIGQSGSEYSPSPYMSEDLNESGEYGSSTGSRRPKMKSRAPTVPVYGPDGATIGATATQDKMTVKLRLNWSLDIKK